MDLRKTYEKSGVRETKSRSSFTEDFRKWREEVNRDSMRRGLGFTVYAWEEKGRNRKTKIPGETDKEQTVDDAPSNAQTDPRANSPPKNTHGMLGINTVPVPSDLIHQNIYGARSRQVSWPGTSTWEEKGKNRKTKIAPKTNWERTVDDFQDNAALDPRANNPPTNTHGMLGINTVPAPSGPPYQNIYGPRSLQPPWPGTSGNGSYIPIHPKPTPHTEYTNGGDSVGTLGEFSGSRPEGGYLQGTPLAPASAFSGGGPDFPAQLPIQNNYIVDDSWHFNQEVGNSSIMQPLNAALLDPRLFSQHNNAAFSLPVQNDFFEAFDPRQRPILPMPDPRSGPFPGQNWHPGMP